MGAGCELERLAFPCILVRGLGYIAAHFLGRRVGGSELREFLLEGRQFLQHYVEFKVGDDRGVQDIIIVVVSVYFLAELFNPRPGFCFCNFRHGNVAKIVLFFLLLAPLFARKQINNH